MRFTRKTTKHTSLLKFLRVLASNKTLANANVVHTNYLLKTELNSSVTQPTKILKYIYSINASVNYKRQNGP